jgi:hypothetical protein
MIKYITIAIALSLSLFSARLVIAADGIGRLFTTPTERANLDYLRQTTKAIVLKEQEEPVPLVEEAAPIVPAEVSMQGYVKRSDGKKGTVWVNHQPMQEGSSNSEVQVGKLGRNGNQVQLKLPTNGKNFRLKAGQVYLPETNSVSEVSAYATASERKKTEDTGTIGAEEIPGTSKSQATGISR